MTRKSYVLTTCIWCESWRQVNGRNITSQSTQTKWKRTLHKHHGQWQTGMENWFEKPSF